jgi:RNA polymerase sigma-70 factor, ECF subfamily
MPVYASSPAPVASEIDEARLVAAARRERAAFVPLYRAYVAPVYRYLAQQVGNRQDAEDLTTATFTKALAGLERYRGRGSFAAWLFSIARHTLLDYRRQRRPQLDVEQFGATLIAATGQPEAEALQAERRQRLDALIRRLPADQQDALALRFGAGLRSAEAGTVMGRGEGAVRMLVHRAITTLRAELQEEDRS